MLWINFGYKHVIFQGIVKSLQVNTEGTTMTLDQLMLIILLIDNLDGF